MYIINENERLSKKVLQNSALGRIIKEYQGGTQGA